MNITTGGATMGRKLVCVKGHTKSNGVKVKPHRRRKSK